MSNLVDFELQKRLCELMGVDPNMCISLDIHMEANKPIKFWVGSYALPSKAESQNEPEENGEATI